MKNTNIKNKEKKSGKGKKIAIVIILLIIAIMVIKSVAFKKFDMPVLSGSYEVAQKSAILIDKNRLEAFEDDGSYREVPVHFYYPENIEELDKASLPLVIFSHGAFGYYESNTTTYMELASNGYVVASLDHPYHAFFTKDSSGKTITVNMDFFNTALNVGSSEADETEVYYITSKWMELREADMNFVIDTIKEAAAKDTFSDAWFVADKDNADIRAIIEHTNTEKIGLMGHSLGGATAVTVGRRSDVSAVIDLDGTMIGEEIGVENGKILINETPYETPLLAFDSDSHHADREKARETGVIYVNNVILDNATTGYSTYIEGSAHMNFTDLPTVAPALAKFLGTGSVDQKECMGSIDSVTLNFFNCYLKNIGEFEVNEKY